jgi:hypothetical protein
MFELAFYITRFASTGRRSSNAFEQLRLAPPPLFLSASTGDLKTVETWITHIGHELDGIVAKRADAPYRPGDDRAAVKIKNYRTIDVSSAVSAIDRSEALTMSFC